MIYGHLKAAFKWHALTKIEGGCESIFLAEDDMRQ